MKLDYERGFVYSAMTSLSNTILASITAGVAGTLVYHFVINKLNEKVVDPGLVTLHVEIPHETVAYLIGRDGTNIRRIENKTNTSITFIDQGGLCRLCVVRGRKEDVESANEKLQISVKEFAQLETAEIFVSDKTLSYLSANNDLKLKEIAASCNARIYIYKVQDKPNSLLVRGVYHRIEEVRAHLKHVALEEEPTANPILSSAPSRFNRTSLKSFAPPAHFQNVSREKLEPTSSDGYCEVFVSSVKNPSCFFVQSVGHQSGELDRLIEEMTDLYSQESFRQQLTAPVLEVGAYAAAYSDIDKCWYRAKIVSLERNEENAAESQVLVQFVDFGDTIALKLQDVATLRSDFFSMKLQAIECRLSAISPSNGSEWNEEEIDTFEMLTHCAQWKVVMARIESYHQTDGVNGKFIPCVKLVDTNNEKDINVGEEMVARLVGVSIPVVSK